MHTYRHIRKKNVRSTGLAKNLKLCHLKDATKKISCVCVRVCVPVLCQACDSATSANLDGVLGLQPWLSPAVT